MALCGHFFIMHIMLILSIMFIALSSNLDIYLMQRHHAAKPQRDSLFCVELQQVHCQ